MLGTTLRHYRVDSKIGEGGMGVVYKGWDMHLDRPVAIKVLAPKAVADPERKRRFVQEAKAASALHHPNIIVIHDVDSEAGVDFIVMEYIDGETLDRRIPSRGMRLAPALKYAIQIADALTRAHAAGIVHRDLKPGNIMVDRHEQVKVLDFGLAKLAEPSHGEADATVTVSPHTEEGTIVGTVAYMSPEQAEGEIVDARSDIFSLGSMLYEMLTGVRPFQAGTRMSTLSAVISKNPAPVTTKVPGLPHELERIISRCLRKDPDRRFQQMNEVKLALEDLREESESGSGSPSTVESARTHIPRAWLAAALAVLVAAGGAFVWWRTSRSQTGAAPIMTRITSDEGLTTDPALSQDGKMIAYASDRANGNNLDIWVQHLGGGDAVRLTKWDSDEREPDFAPDGSRIVFSSNRQGGGIYVVPVLGGDPNLIAPKGFRPRFSPDGNWVAYWVGSEGGTVGVTQQQVFVVPVNGGAPRRLASDLFGAWDPVWAPDGKHMLVTGLKQNPQAGSRFFPLDWWIIPFEAGPARPTGMSHVLARSNLRSQAIPFVWTRDGRWILFSGGAGEISSLYRERISAKGEVKGEPERITFGTGIETEPALGGGGELALASQSLVSHLWSLPTDTNRGKVTGEMKAITKEATIDTTARISPDGGQVLYISSVLGRRKLMLRDLGRDSQKELAPGRNIGNWTSLVENGRAAVFQVAADREAGVYRIELGGGMPILLAPLKRGGFWVSSPDGRFLVTWETGEYHTLLALDTQTHTEFRIASHNEYQLLSPYFSPDGRWMAIHARNSEMTRQILVFPFHPGRETPYNEWVPVTDGKQLDRDPKWSPDGNLLYFLADRDGARGFYAQRLDPASKHPIGPQMEVSMFRGARRSMMHFGNSGLSAPAVGPDKIVFALGEMTGNVWVTKLP